MLDNLPSDVLLRVLTLLDRERHEKLPKVACLVSKALSTSMRENALSWTAAVKSIHDIDRSRFGVSSAEAGLLLVECFGYGEADIGEINAWRVRDDAATRGQAAAASSAVVGAAFGRGRGRGGGGAFGGGGRGRGGAFAGLGIGGGDGGGGFGGDAAALCVDTIGDTRLIRALRQQGGRRWHDSRGRLATLPAGWRKVPSRSRPGEYSYENVATRERVASVPTANAAAAAAARAARDAQRDDGGEGGGGGGGGGGRGGDRGGGAGENDIAVATEAICLIALGAAVRVYNADSETPLHLALAYRPPATMRAAANAAAIAATEAAAVAPAADAANAAAAATAVGGAPPFMPPAVGSRADARLARLWEDAQREQQLWTR